MLDLRYYFLPGYYEGAKKLPTFMAFGLACLDKKYPFIRLTKYRFSNRMMLGQFAGHGRLNGLL